MLKLKLRCSSSLFRQADRGDLFGYVIGILPSIGILPTIGILPIIGMLPTT